MSKDKSQKRKNININKSELWNIFDSEIENPEKAPKDTGISSLSALDCKGCLLVCSPGI